ncbi:UNVERIFIED_CONTAM: gl [Trichonephila clavipes]
MKILNPKLLLNSVEVLTELYDLRRDGYFCRICSFARPSLSSLKKHLQTHNIGRPYSCKVCNKSFALKGNLKTHIRMHTALEEMIAELMELHSRHIYAKGGRRSALSPQRLIARHFPSLVPSTGKKKAAQRKCFVCQHTTQKPQKRSETRYLEDNNSLTSVLLISAFFLPPLKLIILDMRNYNKGRNCMISFIHALLKKQHKPKHSIRRKRNDKNALKAFYDKN